MYSANATRNRRMLSFVVCYQIWENNTQWAVIFTALTVAVLCVLFRFYFYWRRSCPDKVFDCGDRLLAEKGGEREEVLFSNIDRVTFYLRLRFGSWKTSITHAGEMNNSADGYDMDTCYWYAKWAVHIYLLKPGKLGSPIRFLADQGRGPVSFIWDEMPLPPWVYGFRERLREQNASSPPRPEIQRNNPGPSNASPSSWNKLLIFAFILGIVLFLIKCIAAR